jgi:hypothetical protein
MRSFFSLLFILGVLAGCKTTPKPTPTPKTVARSNPFLTEIEARGVADVYLTLRRGACGSSITSVRESGDYWMARTTFGIGGEAGPNLLIHKLSREVVVTAPTRKEATD